MTQLIRLTKGNQHVDADRGTVLVRMVDRSARRESKERGRNLRRDHDADRGRHSCGRRDRDLHSVRGSAQRTRRRNPYGLRIGDRRFGERGAVSTTQLLIAMPVLLATMALTVQAALFFHARQIADQAAQEGVSVARSHASTAQAGKERATRFLDQVGGGTIENRSVTATRTETVATVTVTGKVVAVIPGVVFQLDQTATAPVERFVEAEAP